MIFAWYNMQTICFSCYWSHLQSLCIAYCYFPTHFSHSCSLFFHFILSHQFEWMENLSQQRLNIINFIFIISSSHMWSYFSSLHWMLDFHFHRHQSQSNALLNCYWLFDRIEFSSHEVFSAGKFKWKFKHLKFILGYLFCRSNYHALNTHDASLLSSMYICINIGHNLIVISTRQRVHQMVLETIFYYVCKFQQKYHFNTPTPSTPSTLVDF